MKVEYVTIADILPVHGGIRVATVIQAYYDGSGKSNNRNAHYLTLAGYAGTLGAWKQIEERWANTLEHWQCKYLHMQEAHRLRGEFTLSKGWSKERVFSLIVDLFNNCLSPA